MERDTVAVHGWKASAEDFGVRVFENNKQADTRTAYAALRCPDHVHHVAEDDPRIIDLSPVCGRGNKKLGVHITLARSIPVRGPQDVAELHAILEIRLRAEGNRTLEFQFNVSDHIRHQDALLLTQCSVSTLVHTLRKDIHQYLGTVGEMSAPLPHITCYTRCPFPFVNSVLEEMAVSRADSDSDSAVTQLPEQWELREFNNSAWWYDHNTKIAVFNVTEDGWSLWRDPASERLWLWENSTGGWQWSPEWEDMLTQGCRPAWFYETTADT